MDSYQFDAIVVGSGISGGWAAKELAEKGFKVLMIERGRNVTHGDDYTGEHKAYWEFPFRGVGDRRAYDIERPIQRAVTYACTEGSDQFFVKDSEHPYVQDEKRPFSWLRGYHLGGRSITWGRHSPRFGEINFVENALDGHGTDWPIRYADLEKWYSYVEGFIGVSGQTDTYYPTSPYGNYLPAIPLNCIEDHVAQVLREKFDGIGLQPQATAVLSRPHNGRAACHFCGQCHRGCSPGAYFSSLSSTIPAAKATGNLTIVTDAIVTNLDYDPVTRKVIGVRTVDQNNFDKKTWTARLVFLNASTLPTTQILLNSRSESFPSGLGNSSGVLGHYLMDHFSTSTKGTYDQFTDRFPIGNRPTGIYVPRFQNVNGQDRDFIRGYGFTGAGERPGWNRGMAIPGFGRDLKDALRSPGKWTMSLSGMGECLPYRHNLVRLDDRQVDRWGMPLLSVSFDWGDNERKMAQDMLEVGEAIHLAAGAKNVVRSATLDPGGRTIHEMGTARMGRDPATSFLNGHNQAHEVSNLFVTDGACMASSASQNPSITYMALTARAVDFASELLKLHTI